MKRFAARAARNEKRILDVRSQRSRSRVSSVQPAFPLIIVGVPLSLSEPIVTQSFPNKTALADASGLSREPSIEKHCTAIIRQGGPFHWSRVVQYRSLYHDHVNDLIELRGTGDWPEARRIDAERAVRREARRFIGEIRRLPFVRR